MNDAHNIEWYEESGGRGEGRGERRGERGEGRAYGTLRKPVTPEKISDYQGRRGEEMARRRRK